MSWSYRGKNCPNEEERSRGSGNAGICVNLGILLRKPECVVRDKRLEI